MFFKLADKIDGRGKIKKIGNFFDGFARIDENVLCGLLQEQVVSVLNGGNAYLLPEQGKKARFAQKTEGGKVFDRDGFVRICPYILQGGFYFFVHLVVCGHIHFRKHGCQNFKKEGG